MRAAPSGSQAAKNPTVGADATDRQSVVLADGRHPVLLKAIDPGRGTVTFDLVQFFPDDEAAREAARDHQESPPPNDSYMRNVNPRLRILPVGAGASITANQLAGSNQDIPVSLSRLASLTPCRQRGVLDHRPRWPDRAGRRAVVALGSGC